MNRALTHRALRYAEKCRERERSGKRLYLYTSPSTSALKFLLPPIPGNRALATKYLKAIFFCCAVSLCCLSAFAQKQGESSVKTLSPAEGEREAQDLIAQIRSQRPEQAFTNALLKIR